MTYMNFKLMRKYQCSRTNVSSKITTTASWQDVEGSSITYTPADNSDFVIYEFNTNIGRSLSSDDISGHFKLLHYVNDAWADFGNNTQVSFSDISGGNTLPRAHVYIKLRLDAWTGSKQLKMQVVRYSSQNFDVNYSERFGELYYPCVSCYSI